MSPAAALRDLIAHVARSLHATTGGTGRIAVGSEETIASITAYLLSLRRELADLERWPIARDLHETEARLAAATEGTARRYQQARLGALLHELAQGGDRFEPPHVTSWRRERLTTFSDDRQGG